jgi:uridylate kinase
MAIFVMSVGGSTVVPGGVPNVKFLKDLRALLLRGVKAGHQFVIVTGGGGTCRTYQDALKQLGGSRDDLDWIGIHTTRFNAELLRLIFGKAAAKEITIAPNDLPQRPKDKIMISGGWKPGASTDTKAVQLAGRVGAKLVINVSNVDYLYTKDPRKFKDAQVIEETTWKAYRKMIGTKWTPGMNIPFDPVASKLADEGKIDVLLVGPDTKNISKILSGEAFKGTVIHQ